MLSFSMNLGRNVEHSALICSSNGDFNVDDDLESTCVMKNRVSYLIGMFMHSYAICGDWGAYFHVIYPFSEVSCDFKFRTSTQAIRMFDIHFFNVYKAYNWLFCASLSYLSICLCVAEDILKCILFIGVLVCCTMLFSDLALTITSYIALIILEVIIFDFITSSMDFTMNLKSMCRYAFNLWRLGVHWYYSLQFWCVCDIFRATIKFYMFLWCLLLFFASFQPWWDLILFLRSINASIFIFSQVQRFSRQFYADFLNSSMLMPKRYQREQGNLFSNFISFISMFMLASNRFWCIFVPQW